MDDGGWLEGEEQPSLTSVVMFLFCEETLLVFLTICSLTASGFKKKLKTKTIKKKKAPTR